MNSVAAYDWIASHARSRPDYVALIDDFSGRRLTYAELDWRVAALAGFLKEELRVAAGDRVAVLAHNSTNILEVQFACMRVGALLVPLNVRLAVAELIEVIEDCGARILFHDRDFAAAAREAVAGGCVVTVEMNESGGGCPYEDAISGQRRCRDVHRALLSDTWTLIYTSGTSGRPKGVLISYQMTFYNAVNYGIATGLTSDSHGLTFLPMFHISGLNLPANPTLFCGGTVTVMRRFDPARALWLLANQDHPISHAFGVPANFLFISQSPEFAGADLRGVRSLGVGGAPMPISLLQAYADKGVGIQQAFGMTETGPLVTMLGAAQAIQKLGSSGPAVVHVETMIADQNGQRIDSCGEMGELRVRGPSVTVGYWNRPTETAAAFRDGWLCTGDLAKQDADGCYYIVDRSKNMYISGGENIYPAEVKRVIERLPGVLEVAVVAEPDDKWGEVGHAYVLADPASGLTESDVMRHCRRVIAGYKIPKTISFVEEMPRNATGKIDRLRLGRRTDTIG